MEKYFITGRDQKFYSSMEMGVQVFGYSSFDPLKVEHRIYVITLA
jgi:hypothetical protein